MRCACGQNIIFWNFRLDYAEPNTKSCSFILVRCIPSYLLYSWIRKEAVANVCCALYAMVGKWSEQMAVSCRQICTNTELILFSIIYLPASAFIQCLIEFSAQCPTAPHTIRMRAIRNNTQPSLAELIISRTIALPSLFSDRHIIQCR